MSHIILILIILQLYTIRLGDSLPLGADLLRRPGQRAREGRAIYIYIYIYIYVYVYIYIYI